MERDRVAFRAAERTSLWSALKSGSWDIVQAKLLNAATTAAITTAVAALVSTALLFVSFFIVIVFRLIVVPNGPSSTHQELVFDFTSEAPTAYASFMSAKTARALSGSGPGPVVGGGSVVGVVGEEITDKALMRSRLLDPGQKYDVSVSMVVPETPANREAGMFQVFAELMTARGDVLANATRPASLRFTSAEVRWLRLLVHWPLYAFGLAEETQTLKLPMFVGLREVRDKPFTAIRVTVKPHAHGPKTAPQLYSAHANVDLSMGILTRVMYSYPASSFVVMLVVTWGYMCMAALALFALVVVTGAVRTPSSFASEVVARAKDVMTAKGGRGGGGWRGARLEPFFDGTGLTTSGSDDDESAPSSSRVSSEESYGGGGGGGGGGVGGVENDEGLRRRRNNAS